MTLKSKRRKAGRLVRRATGLPLPIAMTVGKMIVARASESDLMTYSEALAERLGIAYRASTWDPVPEYDGYPSCGCGVHSRHDAAIVGPRGEIEVADVLRAVGF